jgi:hypothetical protein
VLALLAAALLIVMACGGDGDDDGDGTKGGETSPTAETTQDPDDEEDGSAAFEGIDGCSDLVTASEIEEIVGQSVADENPLNPIPNGVGCRFDFGSFDYVTIIANESTANPDQDLPTDNPDVVVVEDFHLAYWQPSLNKLQALEESGIGYSVEVAVDEIEDFDSQAAAVEIAGVVRDNLP